MTNKKFTSWISDDKNQKYVGGVKEGKKHGQGTYTWIGIGEISGIFEEDKFPNYGTFIDYEDFRTHISTVTLHDNQNEKLMETMLME